MKFIHLSDTHIMNNYGPELFLGFMEKLKSPVEKLINILSKINWNEIDFVVFTGDIIHDGEKHDYELFKKLVEENIPQEIRKIFVLGNHDNKEDFYKVFPEEHKKSVDETYLYYSFDMDNYKMIILDSAIPEMESGMINEIQMKWLDSELKNSKDKEIMIFMHHPAFWIGEDKGIHSISNSEDFINIIQDLNVKAIISGHTHSNLISNKSGLFQLTGDSTSFSIDRQKEGYIRVTDRTGYAIVDINADTVGAKYEQVEEPKVVGELNLEEFRAHIKSRDAKEEKGEKE